MDLEPGERVREHGTMRETTLRAGIGREIVQPPLQAEDLTQPLDVFPCEREVAQSRAWRRRRVR